MNLVLLRRTITIGLAILAAIALTRQCRKPAGWFGRRLARAMNFGHARLTAWGLTHVTVGPRTRILDIGCGGGRTIQTMAAMATDGHIDGIDYSAASVAVARETNAALIESGRVSIQQGSVSHLPFPDAGFDLITAVETHYYWPDLATDLGEVRRVLAPGGRFLLIAETYRGRPMDWLYWPAMRLMLRARYLTLDEHRAALVAAGFADVQVHSHPSGWMCAVGSQPA